jgi:hypothetical protein
MTDTPKSAVPAAERNGQLIVSLAIVGVLGLLGGGLIWAGWAMRDKSLASVGVATIIGALSNALTAPSGIGNVIRTAVGPKP